MNKYLLLLTILASSMVGYSQSEFCGHTDLEHTIRAKDSMRYDAFQQNFRATINYFRKKQNNNFSLPNRQVGISISDSNVFNLVVSGNNCPKTKYIIPVVFHIVHNGGSSNIADAQIQHQLEELNKQFANYSLAGSKAVNTGIQFVLANKDVNNNTITGITRHNSHFANHRKITKTDSLMLFGIANLPMAKYLHIWVVNTILDASGTNIGVKAYATRPNSYFNGKEGVVIAYDWLGSYPIFGTPIDTNSKGSTLGHEIGHYLGLYHPFDFGCSGINANDCSTKGDLCCDVPAVNGQNQNCGTYNTCAETYNSNPPDQKENYMDYTLQSCKNTFTANQTSIMHITLQQFRQALWQPTHINTMSSNVCVLSANFTRNKNFMCTGATEDAIFTAYEQSAAAYTWKVWRNGTLTSITSSTHTLTIDNSTAGEYKVVLIVSNSLNTITDTIAKALTVSSCGSKLASDRASWLFGTYAGLGFYNNNYIAKDLGAYFEYIKPSNNIEVEEGSLALSDSATGELLFYGAAKYNSEELEVYGRNYTKLKGQDVYYINSKKFTPIVSNSDAIQAGVAFKAPGLANEYILFTIGKDSFNYHYLSNQQQSGIVYSFIKIDNSNRANDSVSFRHNLNIKDSVGRLISSGEGIAAVRHCNGNDYWVLCKGKGDIIYRLLVTNNRQVIYKGVYFCKETAIQTPIVFSPNGKYINIGRYLFSFNRSNGEIENIHFDKTLENAYLGNGVYGAAFSNNSKVLYRSYLKTNVIPPNFTPIYQYNLESSDSLLSRKNINANNYDIRSLQNTPDGRIFLSAAGMPYVSEINQADKVNLGNLNTCEFNEVGAALSENGIGGASGIDLPNFPISNIEKDIKLDFMAVNVSCGVIKLQSNKSCNQLHRWFYKNNDSSHLEEPTITYTNKEIDTIKLIVGKDTIIQSVKITIPKSDYHIIGDSISCYGDKLLEYRTKLGADMVYNWSCTGCNSSTAYNETFETKMDSIGKIKLTIFDKTTGCVFKDSLNFKYGNAISNNNISFTGFCNGAQVIGTIPTGGNNANYKYMWFMRSIGGSWITLADTGKNLSPNSSNIILEYTRAVNSGGCITYSNIVKSIDLNKINILSKIPQGKDSCTTMLTGSDIKPFISNVTYQWQTTTDTTATWLNIPYAVAQNYDYFYIESTLRFYRRIAISGTCNSISNVLTNQSLYLSTPLKQITACKGSEFPIGVNYKFNNPKNTPFNLYWQYKTDTSSQWNTFTVNYSTSTNATLEKANVLTFPNTNFNLEIGDSVRFIYSFYCGNISYINYGNAIVLEHIDTLRIVSQPSNKNILQGEQGLFIVGVNTPQYSTYQWQDSTIGGVWADIPNSNNDSLLVSTGTCNDTLRYLRVNITHPCGNKRSTQAKLSVSPNTNPPFDYWFKDNSTDIGNEPNTTTTTFVKSEDIWIRHKKDDRKVHQEINTYYDTNYVYVTVRNKGKNPIKGATLYTYWTWGSTNELWTLNWKHSDSNYYRRSPFAIDSFPKGGEINQIPIILPEIPQNKSINICIPFSNFPKTDWYDLSKTYNTKKVSVCLLARIQTCDKKPYGMKFNEIRDVFKNVENNNNIITRNTYARNFGKPITGNESDTISTRNPDGIPILNTTNNGGGIMVGNPTTASTTTNICIKTSDSLFFTKATAYVELHNSLYTQWYTTSNTLSGLTHISGNFFKITSANACLNAVGLPPHFVAPIDYHFGYINKDDRFTNEKFEVSVRQLDNANLLLGECIYVITDNPFVEPYKEFIETDTTLPICYWAHDNNAKNTATFTVSNALPYTISNGTTILSPSITHEYTLTEGEYIVTANDSNANIDYVTYLHVVDNGIDTAETINPISFNCDNTTVTWGAESSDYLVFDKNYIQQTPVTGNQYDLDAMEGKYYEIHNDISGCKVDKRKLEMQDLIYLPESRIALMLADYDLAEDTCCTIELNELNCNDQPLSLNENIAIYNTNLEYLFTAPIQQIGSTSQGFKFCPPYWDTTSAHINHLQSIVYKSSTCQYCRIDFKCDNSVEFDKQTSLNSIKNSDVLVFPNPTENTINVLLTNATNKGTIILLDAIGKEVLRTTFESTTNKLQTIDVSQLPSGVYTIYLPELSIYKKVVIVK